MEEYTDVTIYLEAERKDGEAVHWTISIFGVIFSFGKEGYTVYDESSKPDMLADYAAFTINKVPKSVALKGVYSIMEKARPDLVSNLKEHCKTGNVHAYFDVYFNRTARSNAYNWRTNPCASLVVGALDAMGLSIEGFWGSPWSKDYALIDSKAPKVSNYMYSRKFIDYNGWTKNGAMLDYNDAVWFSWIWKNPA